MECCSIHMGAISQEMLKITIIDMEITISRLQMHQPGANDLITSGD